MKPLILTLSIFMLNGLIYAQSAADEKAVRAVIQKLDDAWNAHEYTYSGKYDIYDQDAKMINPVGMFWKNKAEIVKAHQVFGETMFKYSSSKGEILDLTFPSTNVALAVVKVQNLVEQDYNFPTGEKGGTRGDKNHYLMNVMLARKNEGWKIISQQVTDIDTNAAAHDPVAIKAGR